VSCAFFRAPLDQYSLLTLACATQATIAQQDAQYTQYMYNTININPAYAGSRGVMSIFALHRNNGRIRRSGNQRYFDKHAFKQ
jgi:hypothetical protein